MTTRAVLSPLALLALSTAALAVGSTGRLDDLSAAVKGEAAALEGLTDRPSVKARKLLLKVDGILDALPGDASLADELQAASKAANLVERKLRTPSLLDEAGGAFDAYAADLASRRDSLADLVDGGTLTGKDLKTATKNLAKADKFLGKADAAPVLKKAFKFLGKTAASVADLPGGGGGGDLSATWVVSTFGFAPAGTGYDFDGNGTPNNALGAMFSLVQDLGGGIDLDAAVQGAIDDGTVILLLDMWDVADWNGDTAVAASAFPGVDLDGNAADNFSGSEPFAPVALPGPDGHPLLRGFAPLGPGGAYEIALPLPELPSGIVDLPLAGAVILKGNASPAGNDGIIAFAVPPDAVIELAVLLNPDQEATIRAFGGLIAALADVDTDGNGTPDALSGAMVFEAVPCTVVEQP